MRCLIGTRGPYPDRPVLGHRRGIQPASTTFDHPERVLELHDERIGLHAFLVVDSTTRGTAFGGIRRARYRDPAAAQADARALARAMTLKCALAGLPAGGAKTVVRDDGTADRVGLYTALGDAIDALGGAYVCGPDVGTGPAELELVRARTRYCNPASNDASAATAAGVLAALRAVWPLLGGAAPTGARVLVQGLGGVGSIVARELVALGAVVLGCDVDPHACARASADGVAIVDVEAALDCECDVLAPCALGGVIDPARASTLRARAVCGSANNQLVGDAARVLFERDVLHVPDIVASAGAVIEGVLVVLGGDTPEVRAQVAARIAAIESTAARVLADATAERRPPVDVADAMARRAASMA